MRSIQTSFALAVSIAASALVVAACGRAPSAPRAPRCEAPSASVRCGAPEGRGVLVDTTSTGPAASGGVGGAVVPSASAVLSASAVPAGTSEPIGKSLGTIALEPLDPSGSFPAIIATDGDAQRVWIRRQTKDDGVRIQTVDLAKRVVVETWSSTPGRRLELTGFKRLAFQTLSGTQAEDLARYAAMAVHAHERTTEVPAMSVSVDGSKIAFLVKAGPRLQVALADGQGKNVRRIGTPAMRGEHPSVSPDGHWLAFSACEATAKHNDCERSLFVVDTSDPTLAPRKLPVTWPSAVTWDADSAGLATTQAVALARASGVPGLRKSCLFHVSPSSGEAVSVVCAEDANDTIFAASPNRRWGVFFLWRGEGPDRLFDLRTCDLAKHACGMRVEIRSLLSPRVENEGFVHAAAGDQLRARLDANGRLPLLDEDWPASAVRVDASKLVRIRSTEQGYVLEIVAGGPPPEAP